MSDGVVTRRYTVTLGRGEALGPGRGGALDGPAGAGHGSESNQSRLTHTHTHSAGRAAGALFMRPTRPDGQEYRGSDVKPL